ncbi:DoxX family protein [Pedobacter caeni]|uniref:Putative oxidoreductase n=1 Tax=Pedobacter caeni TaxID=288992 RepID=A0A1M4VZB3_9SPHI|nr:DoxX family protein [Pedobacter caeni]SHE74351.1 putative oxidoreductase [Pedobacter caeni]
MKTNTNTGLLIIRLTTGLCMLIYGLTKLKNGVGFIEQMLAAEGLPTFFASGVYVGELIAPLAIMLGFRTRIAALVMAFNCLVALLIAQSHLIFSLNPFGGWAVELLVIYTFIPLALFFTGGGTYALSSKNRWD